MAQDYIIVGDVTNIAFSKLPNVVAQRYCNEANEEIEDLAQRLGVMDVSLIKMPIHNTIRRYAINFALSIFSQDLMGANSVQMTEGYGREFDFYESLFKRCEYLMNQQLPDITYEMMTGEVKSRSDRSVSFGTIVRA
jgi:hypothetical protein